MDYREESETEQAALMLAQQAALNELNANKVEVQDIIYRQENGALQISNLDAMRHFEFGTSGVTGAIKIKLPTTIGTEPYVLNMVSFYVDIYDYDYGKAFTYFISGYLYGLPAWLDTNAILITSYENHHAVRFGKDTDNKPVIYIGELSNVWSEHYVSIRNFSAGTNNPNVDDFKGQWEITHEDTVFANKPALHTDNFPWGDWTKLKGKPSDLALLSDIPSLGYALESWVSANFDKYENFKLWTNGIQRTSINSGQKLDFTNGNRIAITYSAGGVVNIAVSGLQQNDIAGLVDALAGKLSTGWLNYQQVSNENSVTKGVSANYVNGSVYPGQNHALLTLAHSADWAIQLAGDWRTKDLYLRTREDGTWKPPSKLWHEGHFSQTKINNWETAFGWGDHAQAGYLTENDLPDFAGQMLSTSVEITSTMLYAALNDPVDLISAPGAGKGIDVVRILIAYKSNGTDYPDGDYEIGYDGGRNVHRDKFDKYTAGYVENAIASYGQISLNTKVVFRLGNVVPTSGNGDFVIKIYYRIETF